MTTQETNQAINKRMNEWSEAMKVKDYEKANKLMIEIQNLRKTDLTRLKLELKSVINYIFVA